MKIMKTMALLGCLSLIGAANAGVVKFHPDSPNQPTTQAAEETSVRGCKIRIINDSFSEVTVSGTFDDQQPLIPFYVEPNDYADVSLWYYGYCHPSMYMSIVDSYTGYRFYSNYTAVGSTIYIYPFQKNKLKAQVQTQ